MSEDDRLVFDRKAVRNSEVSNRRLDQLVAIGSRFEGCRFENLRVEDASLGAGLGTSEYIDCSFDRSRLILGPGGYARFVRCSFREVELRDWFCFTVELIDCVFTGRIRRAFFNGKVPQEKRAVVGRTMNAFRGNNFSGTDLIDVGFRTGIDLAGQRLPTGLEYLFVKNAAVAVERTRRAVLDWSDVERRREAIALVDVLDADVEGGQQSLLLRKSDYLGADPGGVNAVFDLLANNDTLDEPGG